MRAQSLRDGKQTDEGHATARPRFSPLMVWLPHPCSSPQSRGVPNGEAAEPHPVVPSLDHPCFPSTRRHRFLTVCLSHGNIKTTCASSERTFRISDQPLPLKPAVKLQGIKSVFSFRKPSASLLVEKFDQEWKIRNRYLRMGCTHASGVTYWVQGWLSSIEEE